MTMFLVILGVIIARAVGWAKDPYRCFFGFASKVLSWTNVVLLVASSTKNDEQGSRFGGFSWWFSDLTVLTKVTLQSFSQRCCTAWCLLPRQTSLGLFWVSLDDLEWSFVGFGKMLSGYWKYVGYWDQLVKSSLFGWLLWYSEGYICNWKVCEFLQFQSWWNIRFFFY